MRIGLGLAVCAAVLAVSLPTALAHKVGFDSNLQLKIDDLDASTAQYSGKIESTKAKCESNRVVTVTANGVVIATATTVVGGAWSASGPVQPKGTIVIATVPRKFLKKSTRHKHKCTAESAQRRAH